LYAFLISPMHATYTAYPIFHPHVTSFLLGPNILLSILSSNTPSVCPSLMWETKFHNHTE
jgi:hypothetical protein